MKEKEIKFGVLGTGAFGSALANILIENNHKVIMYGISEEEILDINRGYNSKYFGTTKFSNPDLISATNNLDYFLDSINTAILAVPSVAVEKLMSQVSSKLGERKINLLNLSKGLEPKTKQFFSQYINENYGKNISNFASLMGPSFAIEVFQGKLTMVNVVGANLKFNEEIASYFNNEHFYVKPFNEIRGAELFSALKNVLAIGLGITSVLYPGQNSHAGLLTMGTGEIFNVYKAMYPKGENTIGYNFSSFGDIFLTCSSPTSRNFSFGAKIASDGVKKALNEQQLTIEGYDTAKTLSKIIKDYNIKNTPFLSNIISILFEGKPQYEIIDFLKAKPL
ncbi:NAD(P)H-dependent glycerol-3-phosphate dehydrogenase [Mycoplasmopsis verecunda]|uniref:Glycerol-3-phosphate dehydrogenase n=1 Tax=Mycoplasmopsis verecunda TaxID=171291 RepID=A0A1T4KTN0_9BACT|nr:NAD(P)H-dependent glycerol-3-phosphate dehydrogenase [Mycoplasmopsis verecunda]WPB54657.1 NAD(P)H-dependent glycerol-3-phosphate dehydrogenase [Mycoplasmopsis verecunda]SJZ45720.1 glycerol-3-phosphate dehydrogenase (NAD(P)+) [Mycoplasmopsis verecunda]